MIRMLRKFIIKLVVFDIFCFFYLYGYVGIYLYVWMDDIFGCLIVLCFDLLIYLMMFRIL